MHLDVVHVKLGVSGVRNAHVKGVPWVLATGVTNPGNLDNLLRRAW